MPYTELPNSSFLDFASWRSGASAPTGGPVVTAFTLNVALILDRANDPSTLLNANWASRQQQLDRPHRHLDRSRAQRGEVEGPNLSSALTERVPLLRFAPIGMTG